MNEMEKIYGSTPESNWSVKSSILPAFQRIEFLMVGAGDRLPDLKKFRLFDKSKPQARLLRCRHATQAVRLRCSRVNGFS
jgi:hypothetical protein